MKRAIVLAGGGSRGAYQLGFWRAIRELGIDYQIVTGSSVGALNAGLMAGGDYEDGLEMWSKITTKDIIETTPTRLSQIIDTDNIAHSLKSLVGDVAGDAVQIKMDPFPLGGLITRFLNENNIRDGGVDVGIMTTEYPTMRSHPFLLCDIPYGMMGEYLLASSTVFPSMEPKEIAGKRYVDGGYSDNFPVNLALDMGAQDIIGVGLKATGLEAKYQTDVPVRVIRPCFDLGPSMEFDPVRARRNIVLGYNDTMRSFGELDGSCFTFEHGETEVMNNLLSVYYADRLVASGNIAPSDKGNYYKTLCAKSFSEARRQRFGRMKDTMSMLSAETAAEIYGVDPEPVYEHKAFGDAVLKAFEPYEKSGKATVDQIFDTSKPLNYKLGLLKDLDRRDITSYMVSRWCSLEHDGRAEREFRTLCRFVPQEFFAALYISFLKTNEV